jgi:phage tail sheath protein FI
MITSDALWKYVSVRRLFIFLERPIYEGTRRVVFERNDDKLWGRVVDSIRLFLRGHWRLGALLGSTEQEAFFITCDRTTMSQDDNMNGRLLCEIDIAPVPPAELLIFRTFQNTAPKPSAKGTSWHASIHRGTLDTVSRLTTSRRREGVKGVARVSP